MCARVVFGTLSIFLLAIISFHRPVSSFPAILSGGDDGGPVNILVDQDEYDDYPSPGALMKRFFTNHPSDYNAMRRPGPLPRGSKRDEGMPFHPLARSQMRQHRGPVMGSGEYGIENSDGYIENGRQKKQTRAATLIFRLGSLGMRRKPTVPPGPTA